MAGRGMRGRKEAFMPRRREKEKIARGKPKRSGAWENGKWPSCPAGRGKL